MSIIKIRPAVVTGDQALSALRTARDAAIAGGLEAAGVSGSGNLGFSTTEIAE